MPSIWWPQTYNSYHLALSAPLVPAMAQIYSFSIALILRVLLISFQKCFVSASVSTSQTDMTLLLRNYTGDKEKNQAEGLIFSSFRSLLKQQFLSPPGLYQLSDLVEEGEEVEQGFRM